MDSKNISEEDIAFSKTLSAYILDLANGMRCKNKKELDNLREDSFYKNMSDDEIRQWFKGQYSMVFEVLSSITRYEMILLILLRRCEYPLGSLIKVIDCYMKHRQFIKDMKSSNDVN